MLRVTEIISTLDADLLGLAEYELAQAGPLKTHLSEQYPFSALFPESTDVALFSRYPIRDSRLIYFPILRSPFLRATVDVEGTPVTVYIVHLTSPRIVGFPRMLDTSARDAEFELLRSELMRETGPLLMFCDCNFTDQSDSHDALSELIVDAFREAGQGMGFTYPNSSRLIPPVMRIDYIWHSDHFEAIAAQTVDDGGASDHRPVRAKLVFRLAAPQ